MKLCDGGGCEVDGGGLRWWSLGLRRRVSREGDGEDGVQDSAMTASAVNVKATAAGI